MSTKILAFPTPMRTDAVQHLSSPGGFVVTHNIQPQDARVSQFLRWLHGRGVLTSTC